MKKDRISENGPSGGPAGSVFTRQERHPPMDTPLLNPHQKLAVESGLRGLERVIENGRLLLNSPSYSGVLIEVEPVPMETVSQLETILDSMLQEIRATAKTFTLGAQRESTGNQIAAHLTESWAALHDLLAAKLNRYGPVDLRLGDALDPHLHRLIRMTRKDERFLRLSRG